MGKNTVRIILSVNIIVAHLFYKFYSAVSLDRRPVQKETQKKYTNQIYDEI